MCDIYLERYIGFSCTGLYVALRSTLPPRLYLDRDVEVEESSFKFVTEEKQSNMNEGKLRLRRPRRLSAESGSCLVQRPVVDH